MWNEKQIWVKRNEPPLTSSKISLQAKKVMRQCWDWNDILYLELLNGLKTAIDKKCLELINRKGDVFPQDNARLYISLQTP